MAEDSRKPNQIGRGTVARGRTVAVPDGKRKVVGHHPDTGKPVEMATLQHFGPDQEVELPLAEIADLRKLGYLVDPGAKPVPVQEGARIVETGVG